MFKQDCDTNYLMILMLYVGVRYIRVSNKRRRRKGDKKAPVAILCKMHRGSSSEDEKGEIKMNKEWPQLSG